MFKEAIRLLAMGLIVGGCLNCHLAVLPDQEGSADEKVILPPGKADNFYSNTAQEYLATARVSFRLDAGQPGDSDPPLLEQSRPIMEAKTRQLTWFLHLYLIDKDLSDGEAAKYGGLRAMVLDGSYESEGLEQDPSDPWTLSYDYRVQVGGTLELLTKIREHNGLTGEQSTFKLKMARLTNDELMAFDHTKYKAGEWSPDLCDCELETVDVKLEPIEASSDAYLDYAGFLDDGVMDLSIHVGWDYLARYDITHSKTLYNWLTKELGFSSPAERYETYNRLSGPLTKTMTVNGRPIEVRVALFRPDPCESWDEAGFWGSWAQAVDEDKENKKRSCPDWSWDDPAANANPTTAAGAGNLMQDLKHSMRTRDAILFTGHSGYTYGYALASWYQTSVGDLDPPEIKTMDLPRDRSQLFVFSGCDTYHVGQAFRDNPNKQGFHNVDVITTTSFSSAGDVSDTMSIVEALVGRADGSLSAWSYGKAMHRLNPSLTDYGFGHFTMYGIHGIDDNPRRDPLGDLSKTCAPCEDDTDCGASGNVCVKLNDSEKVCATACLHDSGCGSDQRCHKYGSLSTSYLMGMACVPKTLSCSGTP